MRTETIRSHKPSMIILLGQGSALPWKTALTRAKTTGRCFSSTLGLYGSVRQVRPCRMTYESVYENLAFHREAPTGAGLPPAQRTRTVWCSTCAPVTGSILKLPNRVDVFRAIAASHRSSRLVLPARFAQWTAIRAPAAACTAG